MADSGLLVVDKPKGWTSHQVVGRLRRLAGTRKVGHAGTLDPMATGVLVVGIEKATRLLGLLALTDKSYLATIRLGQDTVTDDAEGELVSADGAAGVTAEPLQAAMAGYRGTIVQVPSAVSAIKVGGQRAYARVRRGEEVVLAGREVTVSRFDLLALRPSEAGGVPVVDLDVAVDCSTGTYVRALARDLGRDLGTGGHLTALRRTRVGQFELAPPLLNQEDLEQTAPRLPVIPMGEVARRCFPFVEVDAGAATRIAHGQALDLHLPADPTALVLGDRFLALYRPEGPLARAVAVFEATH